MLNCLYRSSWLYSLGISLVNCTWWVWIRLELFPCLQNQMFENKIYIQIANYFTSNLTLYTFTSQALCLSIINSYLKNLMATIQRVFIHFCLNILNNNWYEIGLTCTYNPITYNQWSSSGLLAIHCLDSNASIWSLCLHGLQPLMQL